MFLRAKHLPERTFVDFLYDLMAYEPKDIGILNLALDMIGMSTLHILVDIPNAPAKATFVNYLQQLQEIIWVAESYSGRAILGPLDNFQGVGVRFSHSMPVKAMAPRFNLRTNPRAIEPGLKYVLTGCVDPRQMRIQWHQLLAKWEVRQALQPMERVLFTCQVADYDKQIYDFKTANKFLKGEDKRWLKDQHRWHRIVMKHAGKVPVESLEELGEAIRPTIGFWLFPVEALGGLEGDLSRMKKCLI